MREKNGESDAKRFFLIRPDKTERGKYMDFKQRYFNIWSEAWQLHKKFAGMAGNDEEWGELVQTSEEIMKEYEKEPQANFMKSLLLAVLAEIERNCQSRGGSVK